MDRTSHPVFTLILVNVCCETPNVTRISPQCFLSFPHCSHFVKISHMFPMFPDVHRKFSPRSPGFWSKKTTKGLSQPRTCWAHFNPVLLKATILVGSELGAAPMLVNFHSCLLLIREAIVQYIPIYTHSEWLFHNKPPYTIMEWILLWIWFNNKTMITPSLWDYGAVFPWNPTMGRQRDKEKNFDHLRRRRSWTEMAKAILASFGKNFFIDSLDTVKTLLFTGQEALLTMWPSQHFTDFSGRVDEVKSFLDINSERAVKCRHEDGYIPDNTLHIFLTNHDKQWQTYLLSEGGRERQAFKSHHKTHALGQCHWEAIQGRRIWNPGEITSWWCCVEEAVCSRESRARRSGSHTDNFELEKDFLTYIKATDNVWMIIHNPTFPHILP